MVYLCIRYINNIDKIRASCLETVECLFCNIYEQKADPFDYLPSFELSDKRLYLINRYWNTSGIVISIFKFGIRLLVFIESYLGVSWDFSCYDQHFFYQLLYFRICLVGNQCFRNVSSFIYVSYTACPAVYKN